MILVDTSVWIDHLRRSEKRLLHLLETGTVLTHPLVIEEIACGHLRDRVEITALLHALPSAPVATHSEVMGLISNKILYGIGIGAIDVHLIASAMLAKGKIWSNDKALIRASTRLHVGI